MSTPNEIVVEQFSQSHSYADGFITDMQSFIAQFQDAMAIVAPTIDITWSLPVAPTLDALPSRPAGLDTVEADLVFDKDGLIAARTPDALVLSDPDITVSTFTDVAPEVDTSGKPVLDFGEKPTIVVGDVPEVPEVGAVALPDAPTIDAVALPTLLTLSTPTFAGVDLREDVLTTTLEADPGAVSITEPTPFSYAPNAAYSSALLTALKNTLAARLAGGTGLNTAVEAAIWNRGREAAAASLQAAIDQAEAGSVARGYNLPQGAIDAAIKKAEENFYNKSAEFSRDVAIKQADLEQENLREAVQQGIALEGQLISYSLELEKITFQAAVETARNAIEVHTAAREVYRLRVARVEALSRIYDTIIKGVQAKVEVYRAELQAEETKANVNRALVEQYKAQIEAGMSVVRIYEAQLQAARTQLDVEKAKIEAAGERIRGFVAQMNANTAKVELYKTGAEAERIKVQAWAEDIRGQLGTVEAYRAKADAFRAKSGAEAEKARVNLGLYQAKGQVKEAEYRGWAALVDAERARLQAVGQRSDAILSAWKAELQAIVARAEQEIKHWEVQGRLYEGQQNYTLAAEKLNAEIINHNRQVVLDAAKTAAQIFAQLTASALSRINVSAGVSASSSNSVSWGYTNDTDSAPASVTAV